MRELSLTARLAIALHCLERYCEKFELHHVEIDAFLDDLWEFPLVDERRWNEWEQGHPQLVGAALGDAWPAGFKEFLNAHHIDPESFRELLSNVAEIVFGSFYGAAEDVPSMEYLLAVLKVAEQSGIRPPPSRCFADSRFAHCHGWGKKLTAPERDAWRVLVD